MAPVLEVRKLTTAFETRDGDTYATANVDLYLPARRVLGVVGESGCGKSATVRAILGLLPPNGRVVHGEVLFGGKDLLKLSKKNRRAMAGAQIGFVPQTPWGSLHPVLRLDQQFINVIRAHRRMGRRACLALARQWLERVRLPDPDRILASYAHQLSGGMAQRVVIALAMVMNPRLLIADEPTTALDSTVQRQILTLMSDIVAEEGSSLVLVTHDLGVVAQYCDEVVVMYGGEVVEAGPVVDVLENPAHPYTAALLASMPSRDAERLAELPGSPPVVKAITDQCIFAARCPAVMDVCIERAPATTAAHTASRGLVRCHLRERADR